MHCVDFDGEIYLRQERQGMLMGTYEKACRPWSPVEVDIDFNQQAAPRSMAALRRAKTTYRLERSPSAPRSVDVPTTCSHAASGMDGERSVNDREWLKRTWPSPTLNNRGANVGGLNMTIGKTLTNPRDATYCRKPQVLWPCRIELDSSTACG